MAFNLASSSGPKYGSGPFPAGPVDGSRNAGGGASAVNPTGVRIVSSGVNPADEVRTTLASLNARAKQLVSDGVDHRVVCNGRSLYEFSRQAVEGTRQQVQRWTSADAYAPTSQASVELFMAKQLGFDVQEQQRLLQQLHNSQRQMAADIANADAIGPLSSASGAAVAGVGGGGGGVVVVGGGAGVAGHLGGSGSSVDAVVARLKGEMLGQAQNEVHQRLKELLQRQEYAIFKAAWSPFYISMADDYEMLAMRQGNPAKADLKNSSAALAALRAQHGGGAFNGAALTSGLFQLLNSGSPAAEEINLKIAAFAPIVARYPPAQWISHFAAYVRDRVVGTGDELAALWVTTERILDFVGSQGSAANVMSYVAASRLVMEEKALGRLLTTVMKIDPSRVEEVANMPAGRVMDVVVRASGTTNPWVHVFEAMRVGRYDVATEAAKRTGHNALEAALRRYAEASPKDRVNLPPALELRELYAEVRRISTQAGGGSNYPSPIGGSSPVSGSARRGSGVMVGSMGSGGGGGGSGGAFPAEYDVHKQAVLFLLLLGSTGESADVNKRVLFDLCSRIGNSIDDALWMRLFCIRGVEETAKGGLVQSLSYLQKIVLDDLQDLVTMAHANTQRMASFLVHALLPSSGLRLLLENDVMYVDGLHLILCFNEANLLQCSPLESPIDVPKHIARYCSVVLLDVDRSSLGSVLAGSSVFDYFHKMGFDEAFAEFCLRDTVATYLFGQRGVAAVSVSWSPLAQGGGDVPTARQQSQLDGLLLAGSGPISPDLMRAMANTAELAASRNNTPLALHLLLSLARACLRSSSAAAGRGSGSGTATAIDVNAYATSLAALRRAVKLACPAMAQAFCLPAHTSHVSALLSVCAQLHVAVNEAGVDALSSLSHAGGTVLVEFDSVTGAPQLSKGDLAAFQSLCTMADVFLCAHAGRLEQSLRSFLSLPFIPVASRPHDVERCVAEFGSSAATASASGHAVATAAAVVVPLALRAAASLLQLYRQQLQQQSGSAARETAMANAISLREAMQLVCEWLRRCGSQSGSGGGAGASLYEACASDVDAFDREHLS